jgi:hypothetical protein
MSIHQKFGASHQMRCSTMDRKNRHLFDEAVKLLPTWQGGKTGCNPESRKSTDY